MLLPVELVEGRRGK